MTCESFSSVEKTSSSETPHASSFMMEPEKALDELNKLSHQPKYMRLLTPIFLEDLPPMAKGTVVHRKERTTPLVDAKQRVGAKLLTPLQGLIESTSFDKDEKMHVLYLLLQARADFNGIFAHNETLLHIAARYNALSIVDFLLAKGMSVDIGRIDKAPPLYIAVYNQNAAIVQRLLSAGAKTDYKTKEGKTLLEIAQQKGFTDVVECLRPVMQSPDNANTTPLGADLSHELSLPKPFVKPDVKAAIAIGAFASSPTTSEHATVPAHTAQSLDDMLRFSC